MMGGEQGGGAVGGSETCTLIGPRRILADGTTFSQILRICGHKSLSNQTACQIKAPPTTKNIVMGGAGSS